jgi:sugar phosphate isomerase/epimerase
MKLGVSSYSFGKIVAKGDMSLFDVIRKSKEMGFEVIEFTGFRVPEGENLEDFAKKVKEECATVGIEISNYTVGADFINGSGGDIEKEIERVKGEVRIAGIIGAQGMRHDATRGFDQDYVGSRGFDNALPMLVKGCRAVTEYAESLGVRTMIENHGHFAQDSERVEKLANSVNHKNFGLLVDIGNFICVDEDPAIAVGRVAAHAFHVHAKDFYIKSGNVTDPGKGWSTSRGGNYLKGAIIGHGDVPVKQCLKILKKAGYEGAVSIEYEGMEEPIEGISIGLDNLKRYIFDK